MALHITGGTPDARIAQRWQQANRAARRARKFPVVTVPLSGGRGHLIVIHQLDLLTTAENCPELADALYRV
jgi:hypothetical protein